MSRTTFRGPAHQLEVCMHIIISNNNNYCTRPKNRTERGILQLGNSSLLCASVLFIIYVLISFKITVYTKVYRLKALGHDIRG